MLAIHTRQLIARAQSRAARARTQAVHPRTHAVRPRTPGNCPGPSARSLVSIPKRVSHSSRPNTSSHPTIASRPTIINRVPIVNRVRVLLVHIPFLSIRGQARLADDVGVSRSTISRLVGGRINPSYRLARAVTDALERRMGRPLDIRDVFSTDGTYPTSSGCALCRCKGCLPDEAYGPEGDLMPGWRDAKPGDWSLARSREIGFTEIGFTEIGFTEIDFEDTTLPRPMETTLAGKGDK